MLAVEDDEAFLLTVVVLCRKGLSMYYQGKSQSFACMSEVRSLEDLQKKEKPPKRKMKPCMPAASSCANLAAAGNGFGAPRNIPLNQNCYHQ